MYITKKEAIELLYEVTNSGILDGDIEEGLGEIANILTHEDEDNLSLWGADDEATDLFVAKREDLVTPEWEAHVNELYHKYKM